MRCGLCEQVIRWDEVLRLTSVDAEVAAGVWERQQLHACPRCVARLNGEEPPEPRRYPQGCRMPQRPKGSADLPVCGLCRVALPWGSDRGSPMRSGLRSSTTPTSPPASSRATASPPATTAWTSTAGASGTASLPPGSPRVAARESGARGDAAVTLIIVPSQRPLTEVSTARRRAPASQRRGVLVSGEGGKQECADLVQCCHCQAIFPFVRGSGTDRGWCMGCNQMTCGHALCDPCVPWQQMIANLEAGMDYEAAKRHRPIMASVPAGGLPRRREGPPKERRVILVGGD